MKIIFSNAFDHKYRKLIKKKPEVKTLFLSALIFVKENLNAPSLSLHKLSGDLKDHWAISLNYKLRAVFKKGKNVIIFTNIGDHDEVY